MKSKKLSPLAVYLVCAAAIVLLLAADQYTKSLAVQYLKDQPSIELIPGVLELFYLENRGMAFGLLQDQYWLFAMMTVLFLIVMVIVFYKLPKTRRFLPLFAVLTVLTAGAVGNFYDRFLNHYVVDFIYVSLSFYCCICCTTRTKTSHFCIKTPKRRSPMAEEERILEVTPDFDGKRIDQCLAASFSDCSRSFLQKLLKDGKVSINGKTQKASSKVAAGDAVLVLLPEPEELNVEPENIPLDILYEDDDLLVVNKPKGMVVHPAAGHSSGTLVNAVLYHCRGNLSGINGVLRPGIVHRIDMDTTGALVICKSDFAHQSLAEQLSVHSITRKYRAIVHGNLKEDEGTVRGAIGRHPTDRKKMAINERNGKPAVTHYRVLERFGNYTYIECQLETGRTHQIRVHMASIGHPLLGDAVYGPKKCPVKNLQGQTLHAMVLGFIHPRTGAYMEFEAPLPEYFSNLLLQFRKNV